MLGNDFRSFIEEVKEKYPSQYIEIEKEISPLYETTAIVAKLEMQKRTPILHFKNVKDTEFPVVVNICASRFLVAAALGVPKDELPDPPALIVGMNRDILEAEVEARGVPRI